MRAIGYHEEEGDAKAPIELALVSEEINIAAQDHYSRLLYAYCTLGVKSKKIANAHSSLAIVPEIFNQIPHEYPYNMVKPPAKLNFVIPNG